MTSDYSAWIRTIDERFADHPVRKFLGFRIVEIAPDRCVMTIDFRPEFDNSTGAIHGGILAMLADTAAACALATSFGGETPFATSNMNIHFLRPASGKLTATAKVIKKGKKVCVASVEIHGHDERQVATSICDFVMQDVRAE